MKAILTRCLAVLLLCACLLPCAACAGTVSVLGLTVDESAEVLDFDQAGIDVSDADGLAEAIGRLPALKEVRMFDSTLPQEQMIRLYEQFPQIFFGFTLHISVHTVRTDATAFSTRHMSSPTKSDPRHTSGELSVLRLCRHLKALDIGHNTLTDVNFLYDLPDIEVLIISPNYGLTDISPVAACRNLVYLECFNTPITDLSPLAGLTKLRDLNLSRDAKVTDLSPLYDLPNLERVWWGNMDRVPNEQKKEMRNRHPDCKFVSSGDPTGKGWRDHPHHKEQVAFFKTGVYIPFSE